MNSFVVELGVLLLVALLVIVVPSAGCSCNAQPGKGSKIGQVVKVARVGFIFDTWEVEIISGASNGVAGNQPFHATAETWELAARLQRHMLRQDEVAVTYTTEWACSKARTEGPCTFITMVHPIRHFPYE